MSFQGLSSLIQGVVAGLDPFLADQYVNSALRDVLDERTWSFLQNDGAIVCPTQITAGTASIVQFTDTVTMDATASAALLAQDATQPTLIQMQIRFGGSGNANGVGQIYSITAVDQANPAAIVLTLDREVVEVTNAASGYQCYRCYVKPPIDDFLRWDSFVDMVNGWALRRNFTSSQIDIKDPQRQAQGQAYCVAAYKGNPELQPRSQYELWPHPTSGQSFYVRYFRSGEPLFAASDTQPLVITDQLIIQRAYGYYVYPWAAANVGRFPSLRGVGWVSMTLDSKAMYQDLLLKAKKQDEEAESQNVLSRGHGLRSGRSIWGRGMQSYPIDSAFIQQHLLNI